MKIAITGSMGFVGSALVKYFAAQGHEIIAFGRQVEAPKKLLEVAHYIQQDLGNEVTEIEADVVIHAAALASDTATYEELYRSNVTGTINLMKAARLCKSIVLISSSSVYAPESAQAIKEEDARLNQEALTAYGYTKLLSERKATEMKQTDQQLFILRPRGVYGLGDRQLLPRIMEMVKFNRIVTPGDMNVRTAITHVGNLCMAVDCCIAQSNVLGQGTHTYNICDDGTYTLSGVILALNRAIYGKPLTHIKLPLGLLRTLAPFIRSVHPRTKLSPILLKTVSTDYLLDTTKIKEELGFVHKYHFEDTVPQLASWITELGGTHYFLKNAQHVPWL